MTGSSRPSARTSGTAGFPTPCSSWAPRASASGPSRRTLAQALLCERNPETMLEPCGACPGCVQVEAGTHPDLLEVARPEQRQELPIQVIRDLCADFGLKPARGARKIAIVDDLDDMNDEAANAFLKTLEEPPPGAVLILIGTSPELQLETVVSRCQVIRFDPLPEPILADLLLERGVACDAQDAGRLAALGEGSVSRAVGLADPELERFRRELIDELTVEHGFDPSALAVAAGGFHQAGHQGVDRSAPPRRFAGGRAGTALPGRPLADGRGGAPLPRPGRSAGGLSPRPAARAGGRLRARRPVPGGGLPFAAEPVHAAGPGIAIP